MKYLRPKIDSYAQGAELDYRAILAIDLIRGHTMVAATGDGEDSTGRAKLRLQSIEETVGRAIACADLLVTKFEERGWIGPAISFDEYRRLAAITKRVNDPYSSLRDDDRLQPDIDQAKADGLL